MKIPKTWPVQPLKPNDDAITRATCGHCGLSWDDGISTSMTPVPSARCPFEYFHKYGPTKRPYKLMLRLGNCPYKIQASYATRERAQHAVDFWNTMHGAVNKEPFHAYIKVKQ